MSTSASIFDTVFPAIPKSPDIGNPLAFLEPSHHQLNGFAPIPTTASTSTAIASQFDLDPNPEPEVLLGWRIVEDPMEPEGFRRVALTAEDLLYPQEGDEPVHRPWHEETIVAIIAALRERCAMIPHSLLLSNQGIKWSIGLTHSPDICFFLNAPSNYKDAILDVVATGAQPQFTLEVVSHSTTKVEQNDTIHKFFDYYHAGVPQYIMVDNVEVNGHDEAVLKNYVRGEHNFIEGAKNERGHIRLNGTPYYLGVQDHKPGYLDPLIGLFDENGNALSTSPELERQLQIERQARIDAEQLAADEKTRADNAQKVNDLLRAKLRELGVTIPE